MGTTFGRPPGRYHLMEGTLELDPDVQRIIREIELRMASGHLVDAFLRPTDWSSLRPNFQSILDRSNLSALPAVQRTSTNASPFSISLQPAAHSARIL